MAFKTRRGTVILRQWDDKKGLCEVPVSFETLDDLFTLCLQNRPPFLVDRVIIEGVDGYGDPHTVSLVFQSVTVCER